MIYGSDVAAAGCKYLGTPYSVMDCQAFVEAVLKFLGEKTNLPGSNAWYRKMTWTGTPEECKKEFGTIPPGAFLFILEQNGKEPAKYRSDGIGNASHIGIFSGLTGKRMVELAKTEGNLIAGGYNYGDGAIHSSASRNAVCTSKFSGKSISGGWNRIGLWDRIQYEGINLGGGESSMGIKVTYLAQVIGGTLNLRKSPSTLATRIDQIPDGDLVTVTEDLNGWSKVLYREQEGYVMSEYLQEATHKEAAGDAGETVAVPKSDLEKIYDMLGDWLGLRG